MSKEENRGMIDAYQKMLDSGEAFKEVDLTMHSEPSIAMAEGAGGERIVETPSAPLGDRVETPEHEYHNDYSHYDTTMEERISRLRAKASGVPSTGKLIKGKKTRLDLLEKKVAQLEQAMMLIMETHEQLLDG